MYQGGDEGFGSPRKLVASTDALYRALVEQVPCVVYVDSHELEPSIAITMDRYGHLYGSAGREGVRLGGHAAAGPPPCPWRNVEPRAGGPGGLRRRVG